MSAARCRRFRSLFAGAVLPALKLDRESDHIYPSNLGIHRTKCAFDFFDPTGPTRNFKFPAYFSEIRYSPGFYREQLQGKIDTSAELHFISIDMLKSLDTQNHRY